MNILYVCADRGIPLLGTKGASVHVRSITGALQSLGHHVTLAIRTMAPGDALPALHRVERLETDPETAADQLAALIIEERIEAVIERYSLQSGAARTASRRHALPLTLEVNAPLVEEATRFRGLNDPGAKKWEHATLRSADRIHVVSSALLHYVSAVAPEVPAQWIPNGADIKAFQHTEPIKHPLLDGRLVVGFAGSMKPWHGVSELLDAFACTPTPSDAPPPCLLLVGSGPEEQTLRHRATARDLRDRVLFAGQQPHSAIPAYVRRFDIGVAPYLPTPNFYFHPLKIVEYLAAGIPVVYPDIGDLRALVGGAGLTYRPGDRSRLTDRMTRLLLNAGLRRTLANTAARRGTAHDWQHIARRVLDLAAG